MVITETFQLLITKKAYISVDVLPWSCTAAIFASSVTTFPNKKEILCVLWITIKKNLFKITLLHLCPFISLPTIWEFTLKFPTFCSCLRARTALKPGLNYKVLLTKLLQSQAWKKITPLIDIDMQATPSVYMQESLCWHGLCHSKR